MFTGIISEIGIVKSLTKSHSSTRLNVSCESTGKDLKIGDSVAVNGVCLSVTDMNSGLTFDVIGNTVKETNLKRLKTGDRVNLENAMKLGDPVSGHMVSGHVDGARKLKSSRKTSKGWMIEISTMLGDEKYLMPKCSVAVDGISLTVAETGHNFFRIYLIPHTRDNTILKYKRTGDHVNIEFDMMAKQAQHANKAGSITASKLRQTGFA